MPYLWDSDMQVYPSAVNANTYTNITIITNSSININSTKINITNAIIDFIVIKNNIINVGLYPTGNPVIIKVNGTEKILPVENICYINYLSANFTSKIYVNVSSSCIGIKLYANGTAVPLNTSYAPPYSGLYSMLLTNGTFYARFTYIVTPTISPLSSTYGYGVNLTMSPPLAEPGMLIIENSSAVLFSASAQSGASIPRFALPAGNFTLLLYEGSLILANATLTINRASPEVRLSGFSERTTYGTPISYSVVAYVAGAPLKLPVVVLVNGTTVASGITPLVVNLPSLDAGVYNVTTVALQTVNTTEEALARYLIVSPAPVSLKVFVNGSTAGSVVVLNYGQVAQISARAYSTVEPQGSEAVYVDGRLNGLTIDTMELGAGVHNLTVAFTPSSRNFLPAYYNVTLVVARSQPSLSLPYEIKARYGESLAIPVRLTVYGRPVQGYVDVRVSNFTEEVFVNGSAAISLPPLPAGIYTITVSYPGSPNLFPTSASAVLIVESATVSVEISAPDRSVYGVPISIWARASPSVAGTLSIYVNNTLIYSAPLSFVNVSWSPPRSGVFNITAVFQSASKNYSSGYATKLIYISKANCYIKILLNSSKVYVLHTYTILLESQVTPYIYVDNNYVGKFRLGNITFNSTGSHILSAIFPGDDRYYSCKASAVVEVQKNPSSIIIEIPSRLALPNSKIDVIVIISTSAKIYNGTLTIIAQNINNNNTYYFTEYINSQRTVTHIELPAPGSYRVRAYYGGNPYVDANYSNAEAVTVVESILGVPEVLLLGYMAAFGIAYAAVVAIKLKRGKD